MSGSDSALRYEGFHGSVPANHAYAVYSSGWASPAPGTTLDQWPLPDDDTPRYTSAVGETVELKFYGNLLALSLSLDSSEFCLTSTRLCYRCLCVDAPVYLPHSGVRTWGILQGSGLHWRASLPCRGGSDKRLAPPGFGSCSQVRALVRQRSSREREPHPDHQESPWLFPTSARPTLLWNCWPMGYPCLVRLLPRHRQSPCQLIVCTGLSMARSLDSLLQLSGISPLSFRQALLEPLSLKPSEFLQRLPLH